MSLSDLAAYVGGGLVILLTVVVLGCSEAGPPDSDSRVSEGAFKPIVITYNGRSLRCIEREGSSGLDATSGAYSGLSCDWVLYHLTELRRNP